MASGDISRNSAFLDSISEFFFVYDTPKVVHIRSKRIGILSRLVQLLIIVYIIGYVLIYNKAYQEKDTVVSSASAKVKGILQTNFSDNQLQSVRKDWRHIYNRVWDVTDFVVPPTDNNAFFVTTNLVITPNQTKEKCPEHPKQGACRSHSDCPKGEAKILGHGVNTGQCIAWNETMNCCEISGWCPVENDQLPISNKAILSESKKFTVLIKNQIEFPNFGAKRNNILLTENRSYLQTCTYHEVTDPFCPIFQLGAIVAMAGVDYDHIAVKGGVISIGISWQCDLDRDFMSFCHPEYKFRRLDDPNSKISRGFNFRYAQYFGNERRTLYKAFGINFIISVVGEAGKFSVVPTLMNLGAGLALLSIATVICDIMIFNIFKKRDFYKEKKYLKVEEETPCGTNQTLVEMVNAKQNLVEAVMNMGIERDNRENT